MLSVAPLAGAWIEMRRKCEHCQEGEVAPLAGAWIEIRHHIQKKFDAPPVAPLAGAWIEMDGIL